MLLYRMTKKMNEQVLRQQCEALVIAMMGKDLAVNWWTGPNKAFNGDTPEAKFSAAPETVYAYIMTSAHGEW